MTPSPAPSGDVCGDPDPNPENEEDDHPCLYLASESAQRRRRAALARECLAGRNTEPEEEEQHSGRDKYLGHRLRAEAEVGSDSGLSHQNNIGKYLKMVLSLLKIRNRQGTTSRALRPFGHSVSSQFTEAAWALRSGPLRPGSPRRGQRGMPMGDLLVDRELEAAQGGVAQSVRVEQEVVEVQPFGTDWEDGAVSRPAR